MIVRKKIAIAKTALCVAAMIVSIFLLRQIIDHVRYARQQAHALPNDTACVIMRAGVDK